MSMNIGTVIAVGTLRAFVLCCQEQDITIEIDGAILEILQTEAMVALRSVLDMAPDLTSLAESQIKRAINVECNAAAARAVASL